MHGPPNHYTSGMPPLASFIRRHPSANRRLGIVIAMLLLTVLAHLAVIEWLKNELRIITLDSDDEDTTISVVLQQAPPPEPPPPAVPVTPPAKLSEPVAAVPVMPTPVPPATPEPAPADTAPMADSAPESSAPSLVAEAAPAAEPAG